MRQVCWAGALAAWAGLVACGTAAADDFPSRQITIVVPFAAGGPSDAMARLIAQAMSDKIGARVIVENLPGTVGSARSSPRRSPNGPPR